MSCWNKLRGHAEFTLSRMKCVKDCEHLLRVLKESKPSLRRQIIKHHGKKPLINALAEISHNSLRGNLNLTGPQIRKLYPYREKLRQLTDRRISLSKKKRVIQSGGFISFVLTTLLSALLPKLLEYVGGSQENVTN